MNEIYELLTEAQNIIRDPKNWTQLSYARSKDGEPVCGEDNQAVCWCSLGAIEKVTSGRITHTYTGAQIFLDQAAEGHIADFNDNHDHAEVMAVWDKARELARS